MTEATDVARDDELEWREAMVDWAEATHNEVRSIRRIVQFVFVLWIVSVALGVIAVVVAAS